jgi:hypothetical protein
MTLASAGLLASLSLFALAVTGIENATLKETRNLDGTLHHVQGLDLDRDHLWVTSVAANDQKGYLDQFNRTTAKFERRIDVTDGPRFHPGGFSIHGDSIWVPVAEYKPHTSAVLEEIDKRTLAIKRKIPIADHIGCLAVTDRNLIAGNWDTRQLYVLDFSGKQLRIVDNPGTNHYQDMKFVNGMLVASGVFNHTGGAIDWFAWPSMKLIRRLRSGVTDRGVPYTQEAMAFQGNDLYLVPEDGPSRLFHFVLINQ